MKNLFYFTALFSVLFLQGQVSTFMYVSVNPENQAEFERLETTYWAKIAKKAIEDKKLIAWGLMKKVGMAGDDSNYIFVNIYKDFNTASNAASIWNPAVIGMNYQEVSTDNIKVVKAIDYYQIEGAIEGPSKFNVHNYTTPKNLAGFVEENLNLWKPFIDKNIKLKRTKQTNWGMATRVYPSGSDAGYTVFTRDGYQSLEDAMEALSFSSDYPTYLDEVIAKSKMSDYDPQGFQQRIIYESIKWVN